MQDNISDSTDLLDRMFHPRSIAVLGASDDPARIAGRPIRYLIQAGFAGPMLPVNPNRVQVQGLQAYPSVSALPLVPDVRAIA